MRKLETFFLLGWVLIPGYRTLTGPEEVMGYEGESLSVRCHYEKSLQQNTKFWCKGSILTLCSDSLIKSSSEGLVENGRVSLSDHKEGCYFEITMDKLKREDSGTYQCSIERGILNDRHYIQVTVSPDPKQTSPTTEEVPTSTDTLASEHYQIYVTFLVLICLKIPVFLTMVLAITWMHRRKRQHSDEVTAPETQP